MTMSRRIGLLAQTWYKWKALRLPWRKRLFIGYDLQGNTYWEFRLTSETRWRRIVQYPRSTAYSQVVVTPLWHQWLRYMRDTPPSLEEQRGDVVRQDKMKYLAKAADERWEAKPRVVEDGARPALEQGSRGGRSADAWPRERAKGPSEEWQPAAWSPAPAKKS